MVLIGPLPKNDMKTLNTPFSFTCTWLVLLAAFIMSCDPGRQQPTNNAPIAPAQTLHEAAFLGNEKAIKQHIVANSDLNVKDQYGSTPLTIAITFNKPDIARLLIDAGADIHTTSADGSTPLHTAAFLCRVEIVEALLDKGADKSLTNAFGSTALQSIEAPFESVKPVYDQLSRDLGPLGFKLDYDHLIKNRPVIANLLKAE
jgi:hypothetical protein